MILFLGKFSLFINYPFIEFLVYCFQKLLISLQFAAVRKGSFNYTVLDIIQFHFFLIKIITAPFYIVILVFFPETILNSFYYLLIIAKRASTYLFSHLFNSNSKPSTSKMEIDNFSFNSFWANFQKHYVWV